MTALFLPDYPCSIRVSSVAACRFPHHFIRGFLDFSDGQTPRWAARPATTLFFLDLSVFNPCFIRGCLPFSASFHPWLS
jgi:hypothetical protein